MRKEKKCYQSNLNDLLRLVKVNLGPEGFVFQRKKYNEGGH